MPKRSPMSSEAGEIQLRQSNGCLKARKETTDGMARLVTLTLTRVKFIKEQELRPGLRSIGIFKEREGHGCKYPKSMTITVEANN